jgi:TonB-dependent receptor
MDKELRLRPVEQSQHSFQLGGRHLAAGAAVDYTLQVARAKEHRPQTLNMVFRQSGMNFTYDVSDPDWPAYTVTKGDPLDGSLFRYNSMREQSRTLTDDERSGRVNVAIPFGLRGAAATLKFGGSARLKDRRFVNVDDRFQSSFKAGEPAPQLPLTLDALAGKASTPGFLDGKYASSFGAKLDPDAVKEFWKTYRSSVNQDVPASIVGAAQAAYGVKEDVLAGYLMATLDAGALRVIPGVRFEQTRVESSGNLVRRQGSNVTVTPRTFSRTYSDVFPSVTARLALDGQTALRAAVTTSLVRPDYDQMAPRVSIPDGSNVTASIGNPHLEPTRGLSLDLMAERYLASVGFVAVGVFHKQLRDFIFTEGRNATAEDDLPAEVTRVNEPINGETGKLTGIEAAWQQNLTFLPGMLGRLGVNANYTWTTSSATFESREGTKSRLPGQAGNAANLGLFYEDARLSVRGGYQFSDRFLESLGETASTDIYVATRGQLDVSGNVRLMEHVRLFAEVNNLTNQPLRRYMGRSERGYQPGNEYYRAWGMVGLRLQY